MAVAVDAAAVNGAASQASSAVSYPLPESRVNLAMKFGPDVHMEIKLQEEMAKSELRFLSHRLEDRLVSEMKEYDTARATAAAGGSSAGGAGRGALKRKLLEEKNLSSLGGGGGISMSDSTPWWEREVRVYGCMCLIYHLPAHLAYLFGFVCLFIYLLFHAA